MKIFVGADVPGSAAPMRAIGGTSAPSVSRPASTRCPPHRRPLVPSCEPDLARLRAGALRSSELVGVDGRQVAQWGDNELAGGF
jgi:hypothetical protein